ncbi:hypothetical protein BTHE_1578 [Bifidobacterium thermophilum]|nr:hypothetical protein BTHE_1578 [Bifidobacterium thermophilum]
MAAPPRTLAYSMKGRARKQAADRNQSNKQ